MKRRGPSDLLGRINIATEKANLRTRIADLEAKLGILTARWPKVVENDNPSQVTAPPALIGSLHSKSAD
jgi:hypothetical protein